MDIVIAAAGKGTRLHDHTTDMPKHIIPIAGKPFLFYLLDAIVEAGYRRIFVVGGHVIDKLTATLAQYHSDVEIVVVDQTQELGDKMYGTACPVLAVKELIQGDRFVYTMGDHLLSPEDLRAMQQSTLGPLVAVAEHDEPQRYGVVEYTPDHTLARIVEKPTKPKSNDVNVGLYTLTRDIFQELEQLEPSERGELEITDAINRLAEHKPIRVVKLQHPWMDLGRPEDLVALEQYLQHA